MKKKRPKGWYPPLPKREYVHHHILLEPYQRDAIFYACQLEDRTFSQTARDVLYSWALNKICEHRKKNAEVIDIPKRFLRPAPEIEEKEEIEKEENGTR